MKKLLNSPSPLGAWGGYPFSVALIILIWILCLMPAQEFPSVGYDLADKWVHFLMFGSLTVVISFEYYRRHPKTQWLRFTIGAVLLPMLMGGLVELAQAWLTTTRSGDWFDALADAIGVLIGLILTLLGRLCLKSKKILNLH